MSLFKKHRRSSQEKAAEGCIASILVLPFAILFLPFTMLSGGRKPLRCGICGNFFKRDVYTWSIEGKTVYLCPSCNSELSRKKSHAAVSAALGKPAEFKVTLPDLPGTRPPQTGCGAILVGFILFMFVASLVISLNKTGQVATQTSIAIASPSPTPTVSKPATTSLPIPTVSKTLVTNSPIPTTLPALDMGPLTGSTKLPCLVKIGTSLSLTNSDGISSLSPGDSLRVISRAGQQYSVEYNSETYVVEQAQLDNAMVIQPR
jgi:hypothetical protein